MLNVKAPVLVLFSLAVCTPFSAAAFYKCKNAAGELTFSAKPCAAGSRSETARAGAGEQGSGPTGEWSGYCTITFNRDDVLEEFFSGAKLEVQAGSSYLLGQFFGDFDGNIDRADIYHLIPGSGVVKFSADNDDKPLAVTSNCEQFQSKWILAVFTDVTLYADQQLRTEACRLSTGTAIAVSGFSGGTAGGTGTLNAPELAAVCNGYEKVHFALNNVDIGGVTAEAIPFWALQKP